MSHDAPRRIAYEPALDGLRGLAVAAILVFHGDFGWAHGGFLAVSTFFTLSGFLITSLLIAEWDATGTISLRTFYVNRIRRLWPAAVCTLLLVTLYARFLAGPSQIIGYRHDLLSAMGQVSNWWFVLNGQSYGALFRSPSLVQHYWSLAVEEQFYLIAPPLIVLALRRGWDLRKLAYAVIGVIVASAALTTSIAAGALQSDRIYYGTDTRAVELLVGVLLAILVARRPALRPDVRQGLVAAGAVAIAIIVVLWSVTRQSDAWLYRGGLWAYALLSGTVLLASREAGIIKTALSSPPLRRLGAISYGVYLLHWPIFLWLTPERVGLNLTATFVVRTAVTLGAATLMSRLLELPIRRGALAKVGKPWVIPTAAFSSIALLLVLVTVVAPHEKYGLDIDKAAGEYAKTAATVRNVPGVPRVGVFGDSSAVALSLGVATYARDSHKIGLGKGGSQIGCGIIIDGEVGYDGGRTPFGDRCAGRDELYKAAAGTYDIALVLFGPWDVAEHKLPGDDRWRTVGDPIYEKALLKEANHLVDLLTADGALVEWILTPEFTQGMIDGRPPRTAFPESAPERVHRFNEIVRAIAANRPNQVHLIDLPKWLRSRPGGERDPKLRPDGIHLPAESALYVMEQFLGPEIIASARK